MCAALAYAHRGCQGDAGLGLELLDAPRAAAHHGGLHLVQGDVQVVLELARVGHVAVHPLLKGQVGLAAVVVALPVPCPGGAFTPVLLDKASTDPYASSGRLVEPGKEPSHHHEVRPHGDDEDDVVVLNNAAMRADGN